LAGAGHAHLLTLSCAAELVREGHQVVLVNPSTWHYYSGMGPGLLGGRYQPQEVRFDVAGMARDAGVRFLQDRVTGLDPVRKVLFLEEAGELAYDVASMAIGSKVADTVESVSQEGVFAVKPVAGLIQARNSVVQCLASGDCRLAVAGGGAAGLEVAGNLRRLGELAGKHPGIILYAGRRLLSRFTPRARRLALKAMAELDVWVREGVHVTRYENGRLVLDSNESHEADRLFVAAGVKVPEVFRGSGLETAPGGEMLVDRRLASVSHDGLFGGGDCVQMAGEDMEKAGVHAVYENPVLWSNLKAWMRGKEFETYEPRKVFMQIMNLGDGTGLLVRGRLAVRSKLAFRFKEAIDKRFMRRFRRARDD
jgi:NADH dehydrogenase FAD-containing subunit